jgi:nitrile hydratase
VNGAQDLGGMMGFGPISSEPDEPVFHAEWQKRALGVTLAANACGLWSIDGGRYARETLPPAQYLAKSYYDIWISGLEKLVVQHGLATPEEVAAGHASTPPRLVPGKLGADRVAAALAAGTSYERPARAAALFAPGARVRARLMNPTHHTRLPRYARPFRNHRGGARRHGVSRRPRAGAGRGPAMALCRPLRRPAIVGTAGGRQLQRDDRCLRALSRTRLRASKNPGRPRSSPSPWR